VIVKENMTVISDDMILHKNQLKNEKNFWQEWQKY
jgi:hypothetical protein